MRDDRLNVGTRLGYSSDFRLASGSTPLRGLFLGICSRPADPARLRLIPCSKLHNRDCMGSFLGFSFAPGCAPLHGVIPRNFPTSSADFPPLRLIPCHASTVRPSA